MANVRIAQMGQTAVNRPFFEVVVNGKRYVGVVNNSNRIEFTNSKFLQSLGVTSLVANQFYDADIDLKKVFGITGITTDFDVRFPYVTLGSGFAFLPDFIPYKGWSAVVPAASIWI